MNKDIWTRRIRDIAIIVWAGLEALLFGVKGVFEPFVPWHQYSIAASTLLFVKFAALMLFLSLLLWRGIFLLRVNGLAWTHIGELLVGILLAAYLVLMPNVIEVFYQMQGDPRFAEVIGEAKSSSFLILCVAFVAIVSGLLWPKQKGPNQSLEPTR